MGRHAAPEGRHRRRGALLAQTALIAVLALVAGAVLLGSGMARDHVDGAFASSQTGEAASSGIEAPAMPPPGTSAEASTAVSAPPVSDTAQEEPPVTDAPSSDQVNQPESRGMAASSAPTTPESAGRSADTTSPKVTVTTTTTAPPTTTAGRFASCAEAKAAGVSMIPSGDPRYSPSLDHDGDGTACDRHGDPPTHHAPAPTATAPVTPTRCVPMGG